MGPPVEFVMTAPQLQTNQEDMYMMNQAQSTHSDPTLRINMTMPLNHHSSQMEADDHQIDPPIHFSPYQIPNLNTTRTQDNVTQPLSPRNIINSISPTFNTPSRRSSPQFGSASQLPTRGSIHRSSARLLAINQILGYKGSILRNSILSSKLETLHFLLSYDSLQNVVCVEKLHRFLPRETHSDSSYSRIISPMDTLETSMTISDR